MGGVQGGTSREANGDANVMGAARCMDVMNDLSRACIAPAFSPPTYNGTTASYMRGKVAKYLIAPLGKPFDHPFGSWMTRSAYVPEAGGIFLPSRQPNPQWQTNLQVWRLNCYRCGSHRSENRPYALT
jgi:hypothetical protein